jgi:hypothetical protein
LESPLAVFRPQSPRATFNDELPAADRDEIIGRVIHSKSIFKQNLKIKLWDMPYFI